MLSPLPLTADTSFSPPGFVHDMNGAAQLQQFLNSTSTGFCNPVSYGQQNVAEGVKCLLSSSRSTQQLNTMILISVLQPPPHAFSGQALPDTTTSFSTVLCTEISSPAPSLA